MASAIVGWRLAVGILPAWWFAVPLLLGWLAVPLAAVDLSVLRLPNALTYAAYPILGIALAVAATCGPDHSLALRALLGTTVLGGAHVVLRRFAPTALGAGDVKLAGSLGAVLGALSWQSVIAATALAATITLVLALTPLARPQPTAPQPMPIRPTPAQPTSTKPTSAQPASAQPASTRPIAIQPAATQPTPPRAGATQSTSALLTSVQLAPEPPAPAPRVPTQRKDHPPTEPLTDPKEYPPAEPPGPTLTRIPLLRRAVPHGPGLLIATWLLATFPGQALIGGVTS